MRKLVGCEPQEISRKSVGKILSATPLQGSFGESPKAAIVTERMSLVVIGMPAVPIGVEGFIVNCKGDRNAFTWTGADRLHPMY
jgi:hypothetical protein